MAFLTITIITAIIATVSIVRYLENAAKNRLPKGVKPLPGPKGLPLIGSVHELPEKNSWMKFHEWAEQYGPIYQVNLAGVNHVWIARDHVAKDLLTKKGAIYSDRPHIPALERDNRDSGQYLPLMSRNALWTRQRRFAKQIMDTSEKASFYGYPELESVRLLGELMTNPSQYNVAMESFISRVTSRLAWGTSASSDELKQRARELLIGVSPTGALGNKLPFIMSLPEKLISARAWESRRSRTERKFFEQMQHQVRLEMDDPTQSKQSWMRSFLENKLKWGFASDLEGAFAVGMHGIAGALTIAAPMQSFCLAMCHYPQYQSTLYEEIDRVLGDRMPTYGDLQDMPILRAFIRETLRWRPPVPTGIPHESTQDDTYEGFHIPAGSVMHPLEWTISRDPEVFPEPDEWNPLRWLDEDFPTYQEPLTKFPTITEYSQFGYGRRTCQGMGVTEADLFVGIGSVAWLFSMQASEDAVIPEKPIISEAEADAESWLQEEIRLADERVGYKKLSEAELEAESWLQEQNKIAEDEDQPEPTIQELMPRRPPPTPPIILPQDSQVAGDAAPQNNIQSEQEAERAFFERNAKRIKRQSWDNRRSSSQNIGDLQNAIAAKLAEDEKPAPRSIEERRRSKQNRNTLSDYDRAEQAVTRVPLPWLHANDSGICLPPDDDEIPNDTTVEATPSQSPKFTKKLPPLPQAYTSTSDETTTVVPGLSPAPTPAPTPTPAPAPPTETTYRVSTPVKIPRPDTAPIHGKVAVENDPTMDFSTLLIAKPLPFKFNLRIRNQGRAEHVQKKWLSLKMQGSFEEAKCYWGKTHAGNAEYGWGETFS
ncbi:cytochrome P450 [Hortaea werneckii]|nr:cytochrome P450 [Hortaea werneckii]KAI7325219.1 cytochrome P450 [Hortaea werneckii]